MIINVYSGRCTPHLESITFLDSLDSRFHSRGSDFLDFWKMIFDDMMIGDVSSPLLYICLKKYASSGSFPSLAFIHYQEIQLPDIAA